MNRGDFNHKLQARLVGTDPIIIAITGYIVTRNQFD